MHEITLLPCRWRRPGVVPARQGCVSPIVQAGQYGVMDHQCWMCQERDHLDPAAPAQVRPAAGDVRHLIFHVYPVGERWRWHLEVLRKHMSLFNGRRIVAVATGPGTASAAEVAGELAGLGVEVFGVPNNPDLREMASYPLLMERLSDYRSPGDCHFYGHTKGVVSTAWGSAATRWADAMYEALLGHWPAVAAELRDHSCVGIFKRNWQGPVRTRARWHYSGSFRWVRNADCFARDWGTMDQTWLGSETHPGLLFGHAEASCLYGEFDTQDCGLYAEAEWERWATPLRRAWLESHRGYRRDPLLATVVLTAHRQPDLVHHAVASVLNQTSKSWQLLIVDSGELAAAGRYGRYQLSANVSVDVTGETESWPSHIGRQAWAINQAWSRGRVLGDVVCYLSDDDVLDPRWIETVLGAAEAHPDQSAWYGRADLAELLADGSTRRLGRLEAGHVGRPGQPLRGRIDGMQVAHRRSCWVPWPEDPAIRHEADGHWIDTLACSAPIHPLDASAGTHRHTPLSTFTASRG